MKPVSLTVRVQWGGIHWMRWRSSSYTGYMDSMRYIGRLRRVGNGRDGGCAGWREWETQLPAGKARFERCLRGLHKALHFSLLCGFWQQGGPAEAAQPGRNSTITASSRYRHHNMLSRPYQDSNKTLSRPQHHAPMLATGLLQAVCRGMGAWRQPECNRAGRGVRGEPGRPSISSVGQGWIGGAGARSRYNALRHDQLRNDGSTLSNPVSAKTRQKAGLHLGAGGPLSTAPVPETGRQQFRLPRYGNSKRSSPRHGDQL